MSRFLHSHKVNGLNDYLAIECIDDPCDESVISPCEYAIYDLSPRNSDEPPAVDLIIRFQNGTLRDRGVNGISNEALLAILEDRLSAFQETEFRCRENALALTNIQQARQWLHERTLDRVRRGVEGTYEV